MDRLEWHERKAYVHKIDVDHYTYANRAVTPSRSRYSLRRPHRGPADPRQVMVASLVTLFKLKFLTDENVGWGPIDLPELELQTTAYCSPPRRPAITGGGTISISRCSAGRAIHHRRGPSDGGSTRLGLVTQVRSPHAEEPTIYLYEAVPGASACAATVGAATTSFWRVLRP